MNYWVIFLTGLTVGGLSCAAIQGGLLSSMVLTQKGSKVLITSTFLLFKLLSYLILGALLGWLGQTVQLSDPVRVGLQVLAGAYMIAIALDLLKVHPIFRYTILQPPKFLFRLIRAESKSAEWLAPAFLGTMMVLIPCGTTLAMEALAISSGSPAAGALTMGFFILGTSPIFLGIGLGSGLIKGKALKLAAILIIYLGINSINGALVYAGSPVTIQSLATKIPIEFDFDQAGVVGPTDNLVQNQNGVQTASINVLPTGYSPNQIQVRVNQVVRLNLITNGQLGCTSIFRIPTLGITQKLPLQGQTPVEFTPTQLGKITWTCSMGMYYGEITVVPS